MRIVYIHNVPMPGPAANTVQVARTCSALAAIGEDVALLVPGAGPGATRDEIARSYGLTTTFGIRRVAARRGPGRELRFSVWAAWLARRQGAEVVITRSISCARVATGLGLPVLLELHQPLHSYRPKVRRRFLQLAASDKLRRLIVITDSLRRAYERDAPGLEGRIATVPDGAEPAAADIVPMTLPGRREALAVGYTGHLYAGKGMEVIPLLAARCPWADFHVVGGMPEDVTRWRAATADQPNIMLHGRVPHAAVSRWIAAFDVVLAPYQRSVHGSGGTDLSDWMSPLKLFEYMAQGKPIVCADLPVLREVMTDGVNGLLSAPDDIDAWAASLTDLRDRPDRRAALGATARADFLARYTWEQRARRLAAAATDER